MGKKKITVSARADINKTINIATVYWILDDDKVDGLPRVRFHNNYRPPSNLTVKAFKDGSEISTTFPITPLSRSKKHPENNPTHGKKVKQELEISLDEFIHALPADASGHYSIEITPPSDALSSGAAAPATGTDAKTVTPNSGWKDKTYYSLLRPIELTFDIAMVDEKGHQVAEIQNIEKVEDTAKNRGPHWHVLMHPKRSSGLKQRVMVDWKPDMIRREEYLANTRVKKREKMIGGKKIKPEPSVIVLHNISGSRENKDGSTNKYPPGAGSVANFLREPVKNSIHYVIDVDGHATKLTHEAWSAFHGGADNDSERRKWEHLPRGGVNLNAVGIEHALFREDPIFYDALIDASVDLVTKIANEYPQVMPWNVMGHSTFSSSRTLCPGVNFPWQKYQAVNITRGTTTMPLALNADPDFIPKEHTEKFISALKKSIYSGFFDTSGDDEAVINKDTKDKDVLLELQDDLAFIGYKNKDSGSKTTFGKFTEFNVQQFHSRFFNGNFSHPIDTTRKSVGEVNWESALQIKKVRSQLEKLLPP